VTSLVLFPTHSYSALKSSLENYQTREPAGSPPLGYPKNSSTIELGNDGTTGAFNDSITIKGIGGFHSGDAIEADAMYFDCGGGKTVTFDHPEITFVTDENDNVTFNKVSMAEFNQTQVAALNLSGREIWCKMVMPTVNGYTWSYPNAMRFDGNPPSVGNGKVSTFAIDVLPGGDIIWRWRLNNISDYGPDPDGDNGNSCPLCGDDGFECYKCNKTATWYNVQIFRAVGANGLFTTPSAGSAEPAVDGYIIDGVDDLGQDRFPMDEHTTYCYILRLGDSAGNFSITTSELNTDADTLALKKCVVPDDTPPSFSRVDFFTSYTEEDGFSGIFGLDSRGDPVVTSNPCHFSPTDCTFATPRKVQVKITASEPLFDGQNRYGATRIAGDLFDNDNDGNIDEESGGFNTVNEDNDNEIDDDVAQTDTLYPFDPARPYDDHIDNDADGYIDEMPNGDANYDGSPEYDGSDYTCQPGHFYNYHQTLDIENPVCVPFPAIKIAGPDTQATVPGPKHANGNLIWICTQDGITTHPDCVDQPGGTSIYRFEWDLSGAPPRYGVEEGEYSLTITAADGAGNVAEDTVPLYGDLVNVDNSAPEFEVKYYSNNSFSSTFTIADHDNDDDAVTPDMPIAPIGTAYLEVSSWVEYNTQIEYLGATPSVFIFTPDEKTPAYMGEPQPVDYESPTFYTICDQSSSCDYCTGDGCIGYDPLVSPCAVFRGCFEVASGTINNGYAAITVMAPDMRNNQAWDMENYQAAADQKDQDGFKDDTFGGDKIPNYVTTSYGSPEPDTELVKGQLFAIDTLIPEPPAMSLPVSPCDGIIARTNMSCSNEAATVKNPSIRWTMIDNDNDDDFDGSIDEECVDGIDNDGDGTIDEDARVCDFVGTPSWQIGQWKLQIATTPGFDDGTIVLNTVVTGTTKQLQPMAERTVDEPYYWRVAPYDRAGNIGPWNPYPVTATQTEYFTFGIDTLPPQLDVTYYLDSDCSVPMPTTPQGVAITGDTASNGQTIVCIEAESAEPISESSVPVFETWQSGALVQGPYTMIPTPASSTTTFRYAFEVDALGSGKIYNDGEAFLYFTTRDQYGNELDHELAATGSTFMIDATLPELFFTITPSLASNDNDHDGTPDELEDDAVKIQCNVSKYIGESFNVRVKQKNFVVTPSGLDDLLDNDCDGSVDEELDNDIDDDGDGLVDEDIGTSGGMPGSGCWVELSLEGDSLTQYAGYYNVVPDYYDGQATITAGDTEPNSRFYLTDLGGNYIYTTANFDVDTIAPSPPTLIKPTHNQYVNDNTPQMGWRISNRVSDLLKYKIEISTSSSFSTLAASKTILDDGYSSTFYTTINDADIINGDTLPDNKYYWRMFTYDQTENQSLQSITYVFYVDTEGPAPPVFDAVTNPTTKPTSPLSGYTSPVEANAQVNIYINNIYIGTVYTDSGGKFELGIDYDLDGVIDEDPVNGVDDDLDGLVDEDPDGIFLLEGPNTVEAIITDSGGNVGTKGCDTNTSFYDSEKEKCIINLDSGPPKFVVTYYSDAELTQVLPTINTVTGKQATKAGNVYMRITSSEELVQAGAPNPPTFSVDFQGTVDVSNGITASVDDSYTEFIGSFEAKTESAPYNIDGDAKVVVIGVDKEGNQTPAGTLPTHGAYITVDTSAPTFRITYWKDSTLQTPLRSLAGVPQSKDQYIYLRITANEVLSSAPGISINQPGSSDVSNDTTTALDLTGIYYKYAYNVRAEDGSNYIDGIADVTMTGTDIVGNTGTDVEPSPGGQLMIDTTAPQPPVLSIDVVETSFTQVNGSGSVKTTTGAPESYANIEVYVKLNAPEPSADDGADNDGDGRIDEEPGGADGRDNDKDGFIDEDYTTNACLKTTQIWSSTYGECIYIPADQEPVPDGTATADEYGNFEIITSGIIPGVNYIYAKAIDKAGNESEYCTPIALIGLQGVSTILNHDFKAGWNLVGIPLQPVVYNPAGALMLYDIEFFQYKSGAYVYDSGLDPAAPGMCYWAYFPTDRTAVAEGIMSTTNTVQLQKGWNLATVPYNKTLAWGDQISVMDSTGTYPLNHSYVETILETNIYKYDPTNDKYLGPFEPGSGESLEPWEGIVIKALQDCTLVFPSIYSLPE